MIHSSQLTGTSLPGPRFSWITATSTHLTLSCEGVIGRGCTAEFFVIMSVCPSLFWDPVTSMRVLRSEDRASEEILSTSVACSLNSSTGPTCSLLSACVQAHVFLISVRLIFRRSACAKIEALWASSGGPRVGNLRTGFFFA